MLNAEIFRTINDKSLIASMQLATMFGEPEMLKGYGQRFTTRLAIAPTTSSSFILGQVSPSIEPLQSNYFIKDLAKGKFVYRNPYLKKLLKSKEQDTPEVWNSILLKGGSVQHLEILDSKEKSVFKTFGEISQLEIVQQAAQRQKFIDQGQSLNLMIHPDTSLKDVNALFFEAWALGIKTLYYQRSVNMAQQVSRDLMECSSCEG
jgi:ribonucleoside-diphosphate reductase alpha chain